MTSDEEIDKAVELLEKCQELTGNRDVRSRMQLQVNLIRARRVLADLLEKEFPLDPPRNEGPQKHMLGRDEIRMIRLRHERGDSFAKIAQGYPDFHPDHVKRAAQGRTPYGPKNLQQHPSRARFSRRQDLLGDGSRFSGRQPIIVDLDEE